MPSRDSEEDDDALSPPGFTTPTKAIRNDGACHAEQDAEETEDEFDADAENQFGVSTGKKATTLVTKNTDLSSSGSQEKMQYWRRPKFSMKFTPR